MPVFDTPEPISAEIDLAVGDVRITAGDRQDTAVDVRPSDSAQEQDVRVAEQTRVEFSGGSLLVRAPRQLGRSLLGRPGSVDITIALPAGSRVRASVSLAAVHCAGRLGECRLKASAGDIEVELAGPVDLSTGAGAVVVDRATGRADISTGTGRIRLGQLEDAAVIKNSNGDTRIGSVAGDLRVSASNGDITVGRAAADVRASTAHGHVRVDAIVRGTAALSTGYGDVEVGIPAGTAARLDVHTKFGHLRNDLEAAQSPGPADETADVSARTSFGDIVIRRSRPAQSAQEDHNR
jgi:hypothetical protein